MAEIVKFECVFCKDKGVATSFTRKQMRNHLANKHIRGKSLFNFVTSAAGQPRVIVKQNWLKGRK